MTDAPQYLKVKCRIGSSTRDAVYISNAELTGRAFMEWIPLSLIHGGDELKLRKAMRGDVMTLRIMDWKVKALDLQVTK